MEETRKQCTFCWTKALMTMHKVDALTPYAVWHRLEEAKGGVATRNHSLLVVLFPRSPSLALASGQR